MGNLCSVSISTEDTASRCWDCIDGQASYICNLESNLKGLAVAVEELKALRDDIDRKVDLAEQRRMKRLSQVQVWLSRSQTTISEAEQLLRDAPQETERLCLGGCFSKSCISSYKFGRQVRSKLEGILELKSKGVFEEVAENEPGAPIMDTRFRPTEDTIGLESTFEKVWSLLAEKGVGIIGLYGLGGVGKTTLLTQINNKLSITPSGYDVVIWVTVSKDHNIENVQAKLGEKLHLSSESWKNKSSDEKAQDIYSILRRKKFVLLLDDIWERVDLIKVGVPLPSQENDSQVVFTTRLLDVCGEMEAKERIKVRCLGEIEAWTLFQQKVGEETLHSHPDILELAKKVAAECRGLPLAVIVIGRAMTGKKSPKSWGFAIEILRNSAHKFVKTTKELYPILKFSYDNLPSNTMRSCLLYCCLFPEDHRILKSSLIEYWFCEGLLDVFESISKARMQGHDIIDSLVNASLLEQDEDEECVKMHDVIRDMALWISCECEAIRKRSFVQAGLQLVEAPEVGKWEGVRRVSLMQNQIQLLISTPKCPNLHTLFLNHNDLRRIENGFFEFMPQLKVLNLSCCKLLWELPEGISKLVSLEYLDLSLTSIHVLPVELKSLTKLKHLSLEEINYCIRIPHHLISSFLKLQVFRIRKAHNILQVDKSEEGKVFIGGEDEGLIEELGSLQHLNEIRIEMKGTSALERFLRFHNLQACTEDLRLWNFSESEVFNILDLANMKSLTRLSLYLCERVEEMKIQRESDSGEGTIFQSSLFPTNNTVCFHLLEYVHLSSCDKLRDMTWLFLAPNLRVLYVSHCAKMKEIMNEQKLAGIASPDPFLKLETLWLFGLRELRSIYWNALPFQFLRKIEVINCHRLKKLPLNSDSAKENNLCISGQEDWWGMLEWEDEATQNAFLPCFKPFRW